MRQPKVFISHSSKSNANNRAFLNKLSDALKNIQVGTNGEDEQGGDNGSSFDVLVDSDLQGGDKWHAKISEWMHECDAAVILLTPQALDSNWVQQESTVVAVRDRNEADFKLIPVLLNGITAECVTQHDFLGRGSAAQLNDSQFIRNDQDSDHLISLIVTALATHQPNPSPFGKLESVISQLLNEVATETLEQAWKSLDGEHKPTWQQDGKPFSDALTRYLFRQQAGCMQSFKTLVNNIRPKLHPRRTKELFDYIRPLWVDPTAAACLPATEQQQKKMAVMNGNMLSYFTFSRYIERAWPINDQLEQIYISQTDDLEIIQKTLRDHFQPQHSDSQLEPEECDEDIMECDDPILVYLPASQADGGLLDYRMRKDLTTLYPNVIFVMGVGETLENNYPEDILTIRPELDIQNERKQWHAEGQAMPFLARYCG